MARGFRLAGHEIVSDPAIADFRVVNSCTVTKSAGADSRKAARRLFDDQKVVVTGCHSEMKPDDFLKADFIVPNAEKEELAALVMERFGLEGLSLGMDVRNEEVYPLNTKNTRAFVKIQDGCNMRCSFCLTTLARGVSRSRDAESVIEEIAQLADAGCKEAVLTGVHAGSYGLDIHQDFGWLIDRILSETNIPRLRLSSLEPWNFSPAWVELWQRFGQRLCRHLHMSLQSGSDSVLPRMCRNYDQATFAEKMAAAREGIPGIAMTTDIIVGFPGETDAEHVESLDFVREIAFAGAHLFTYSSRPGTAAERMPGHLPATVKKERFQEMQAVIAESETAFRRAAVGSVQQVLWERVERTGQLSGLTDHYLRVTTDAALSAPNTLEAVKILREENGVLRGEPVG